MIFKAENLLNTCTRNLLLPKKPPQQTPPQTRNVESLPTASKLERVDTDSAQLSGEEGLIRKPSSTEALKNVEPANYECRLLLPLMHHNGADASK